MEKFRSFSITHKGAKHEEGTPCQDASAHLDPDTAAIAVVADGHGSSRCFRSDVGSAKAVEITKNCINAFVQDKNALNSLQDLDCENGIDGKSTLRSLGRTIINKWFNAVMAHETENPLEKDPEIEKITQKYKDRYLNNPDYRCHAYGTTLIAAAVADSYWFAVQVGDGKCVVLYEDGSWALPTPPDDRCSHNTTTSLCDDEPVSALSELRGWFGFKNIDGTYTEYAFGVDGQNHDVPAKTASRPLAIFIGSDGVEDSYPRIDNDKYIINFYRNRIVSLAENGFEAFSEEIDGLAKRFADRESTDDVSIAGIVGDFSDKTEMINKMKAESAYHETSEKAAVKRRDADEKKDALAAVQKRTEEVTANQRQMESKVAAAEADLNDLVIKKQQYESALTQSNSEIAVSDRETSSLQDKSVTLNLDMTKMQKRKHHSAVKQYQAKINEIDKTIKALQTEIEKLNTELEPLREQNKKQTDILNAIQVAWEKAEQEAKELEAAIRKNN